MHTVVITGTGGSGVSTVAAGLAHQAAEVGGRTLLLSGNAEQVTAAPEQVGEALFQLRVGRLSWAEQLLDDFAPLISLLPSGTLPNVRSASILPIPGFAALSLLSALRTHWRGDWSHIVVDAGGLTEALDWLTLPDTVTSYLRTWWSSDSRIAAAASGHNGMHMQALAFLEAEANDLAEQLRSRTVDVHLVAGASTDRLAPALTALPAFALFDLSVTELILTNWSARRERDVRLRARLADALPEVAVRTVQHHRTEEGLVQRVGAEIYPTVPEPVASPRSALRVGHTDGQYTLHWRLPFAQPETVRTEVAGENLTVTLGQRRRQVPLPSVLRRCVPTSAEMVDGTLVMGFVRDERLWPEQLEQE